MKRYTKVEKGNLDLPIFNSRVKFYLEYSYGNKMSLNDSWSKNI